MQPVLAFPYGKGATCPRKACGGATLRECCGTCPIHEGCDGDRERHAHQVCSCGYSKLACKAIGRHDERLRRKQGWSA